MRSDKENPMARDQPVRSAKHGPPVSEAYTERRRQIAAAAAGLFLEAGASRVSMDEIAEAAGLAKPSLYHYFSTRDEILYAIHEEAFGYLFSHTEQRTQITRDPEQLLRGVFEDSFGLVHSLPGYSRVVNEQFRHLSPEYRAPVFAMRRRWQGYIEGVIQSGIDTGAFANTDPHHGTLALSGMVNWAHQWYRSDGQTSPEKLATMFYGMFMRGIAGREPPRRAPAE
jgi:TetR/AcrR family transcriptional regulator, cholesterol catabolism regulator